MSAGSDPPSRQTPSTPTPPPFQQTLAYIDWVIDSEGSPVVRIFGSATTGQKSLMHLHGCYPYLFCDIPQGIPENEFAVDIKFRLDSFLRGDRRGGRARVHDTMIVSGQIPIYGYAEARNVCKIELCDPQDVRRACEHLASESFRVYNANVGFLLQVMVDHDLAGMDDITCKKYCFRGPLPEPALKEKSAGFRWTSALELPLEYLISSAYDYSKPLVQWWEAAPRPARTSSCELELDVYVTDIISNKPHVPLDSLAGRRIKFVKSLSVWWLAEEARRKVEGSATQMERREAEEEEGRVAMDSSVLSDPYNFRSRIETLVKTLAEINASTGTLSTPTEVRRTKTPYETGRIRSFITPSSSGSQESVMSQETLEVFKLLESLQAMTKDNVSDKGNPEEENSSPSQMTDEDLLRSSQRSSDGIWKMQRLNQKLDRGIAVTPTRRVTFDPALDGEAVKFSNYENHDEGEDDDDDEEEEHSLGNDWQAILSSQKDFVERDIDGQLEGGVFDGTSGEAEAGNNAEHIHYTGDSSSRLSPPTDVTILDNDLEPPSEDEDGPVSLVLEMPSQESVEEKVPVVDSQIKSHIEEVVALSKPIPPRAAETEPSALPVVEVAPGFHSPFPGLRRSRPAVNSAQASFSQFRDQMSDFQATLTSTDQVAAAANLVHQPLLGNLAESAAVLNKQSPPEFQVTSERFVLKDLETVDGVSSSHSKSSVHQYVFDNQRATTGDLEITPIVGHTKIQNLEKGDKFEYEAGEYPSLAKAAELAESKVTSDRLVSELAFIPDPPFIVGSSPVSKRTKSSDDNDSRTHFLTPAAVAPRPGEIARTLNQVVGRALYYSDPRDEPKRIADEFRNAHVAQPKALLETLKPCFEEEPKELSSSKQISNYSRWFEPIAAAPRPDGHINEAGDINSKGIGHANPKKSKVLPAGSSALSKSVGLNFSVPSTSPSQVGSREVVKEDLKVQPADISSVNNEDNLGSASTPAPVTRILHGDSASSAAVSQGAMSAPRFFPRSTPRRLTSQLSQISSLSHATPGNPVTGNQKRASLRTALEKNPANNQLTLLGIEILAYSRPTAAGREGKGKPFALIPDPDHDAVLAIFFCIRDDEEDEIINKGRGCGDEFGVLYVNTEDEETPSVLQHVQRDFPLGKATAVKTEHDLFITFVDLVREVDPDVLMGWEVQKESLGYLLQRAKILGLTSFARDLSRVPFGQQDRRHENDSYGDVEHSGFWLAGRHIFNLWRVCREELKLYTYTVQNVLFQLTGEKLPKYSCGVLSGWWESPLARSLVVKHFRARTMALLRITDHLDVLGRNSELARLFGMDLFSVMTRGSQFRVEAVLLRVCRGLGYLMLSPTPKQVASQPAMEATPLIFEPESALYTSPVVVLDFRSLYPSVIIANNICFSTCLGRLKQTESDPSDLDPFLPGLGCDPGYAPPLPILTQRDDFGFVSPNGVCFVSKEKREGLLPRMLREILDARVMIKKSVEGGDVDEAKKRVADARQFGLKMIANVTYGYTAASFSGRMPCAEIADAIVQTGRACLEFAIKIVLNKSAPWAPAECVYGDTDSLFVHLPGRDLEQARQMGKMISEAVSAALPSPMKLQFEKVYFPCVLEVKKRYVGWKFSASKPTHGPDKGSLDAKGIETIRRDGCPAVVKTMELVMKELFTTRDLSRVKLSLRRQFDRMFAGTTTLSDFILSGKVKLGNYAKDRNKTGNYPPAAVVADKMQKRDPRAKPVYKERVCYVVACGPPGSRLIDLVVDPHEFMLRNLRINVAHYVFKLVLPALDRLLACAGIDVKSWFSFDKTKNLWGGWRRRMNSASAGSTMIHRFFEAVPCVLCSRPSIPDGMGANHGVCAECGRDLQRARIAVDVLIRESEARARKALNVCGRCVKAQGLEMRPTDAPMPCPSRYVFTGAGEVCLNLDCEDFFSRRRAMDRVVFDVDTLSRVGVSLSDLQ